MGRDRSRLINAAAVVPAAFFAVFFAYPVATVLWRGLGGDGFGAMSDVWATSRTRDAVWFTMWQATLSTVVTLAVALPAASIVARATPRMRRRLRALVTVPFVMPTVLVAGAFAELFARTGLDEGTIRARHTIWAILIAHLFFNYAVVVRSVGSFWAGLDPRMEEQARMLGASRRRAFTEVTLPRLRPVLASAASIVFLFSFTSFGVILVLGGPRQATIETEIHRYAVTRTDFRSAAAIAVLQLVAVVALVAVTTMLERRRPITTHVARPLAPSRRRWRLLNGVTAALLLVTPIAVIVERSFAVGGGYGLDHYRALSTRVNQLPAPATTALRNTIVYASLAMIIAIVVGTLAALIVVHGRRSLSHVFDLGLTIPLGTSAVTIGFGILLALDEPPVDFRTRWWIVPVAHALVGVPFVVRTMVPILRRIDPALREAAATLGAPPSRVRREIDLPIARRGLLVGAGFAFAVSVGEFGATAFLPRRPETLTAPRALFRLLSTPGDLLRGQAMALAVVMMVLVAAAAFVIESGRSNDEGVF
ncbi:MAG: iron ABC transporter permease [Acidimicrobiales bacterium]|nr:iron ABC transporter permease [Acidimicrobiales bacterium]